ncbi:MAG: ABC transporter ATP-binding protein [Sporomusaceae bacterium]|nr:ABC transporter ATP-binding protein [Sporomusaceae bacterium]
MSILKVENLQVGYGRRVVVQNLELSIRAGAITTIIGPNGCGKSTLLKTMGRIIQPQAGAVYLRGNDLRRLDTRQVAKQLTLLPQTPAAPPELKVEELVAYGRFPHRRGLRQTGDSDRQAIEQAMSLTRTLPFRQRPLGSLSGGERQKVWLAMALAQETDILLLDEPTTYLDMVHQLEVLKIIAQLNRERQCTVVMVLHDINHAARFSHEMVAMKAGKVVAAGSPRQIVSPEVLKEVFDIQAKVVYDPEDGVPICLSYDNLAAQRQQPGGVA